MYAILRLRETKTQLPEHYVSKLDDARRSFTFCDSNNESNNQETGSKYDSSNQVASMGNFCDIINCDSPPTRANLILRFLQRLKHKEGPSLQHFDIAFLGKQCCGGNIGVATGRVCNLCFQAENAFCDACYQWRRAKTCGRTKKNQLPLLGTLFLLVFFLFVPTIHQTAASVLPDESAISFTNGLNFPTTLSLWLMPPEPNRKEIQEQINTFAANNNGPVFVPHITVIGGITCQSEKHLAEIVKKLRGGLKGFGSVPCRLVSGPFTSKGVWSQAYFMVLDMCAPFMNWCQKSRAILGHDTERWRFASPADLPHLSLFYGTSNIPDKMSVKKIHPSQSFELALWQTDPQTIDGVPRWKEVATIDLN